MENRVTKVKDCQDQPGQPTSHRRTPRLQGWVETTLLERVLGENGRFERVVQRSDLIRTIVQARSWYLVRLDG